MWMKVLQLEWRILRRGRAAFVVLGIFTLFLMVAALAGGRYAADLEDGLLAGQAAESERLSALKERLILSLIHI